MDDSDERIKPMMAMLDPHYHVAHAIGRTSLLQRLLVVDDSSMLKGIGPDLMKRLNDVEVIGINDPRTRVLLDGPRTTPDISALVAAIKEREMEYKGTLEYDLEGPNEHGNRQQRRAWKAEQRRAAKRNRK